MLMNNTCHSHGVPFILAHGYLLHHVIEILLATQVAQIILSVSDTYKI